MNSARIRFATDILRRLGEELNPSPDQGILELVKNSYDADAINCRIELLEVDRPGGSIRIVDDGEGMDAKAIENGWLVLGKSPKTRTKRTKLGRIPAGNKGLGRLAALRMGTNTSLTTCPKYSNGREYHLEIDWSEYENAALVDQVELNIIERERRPESDYGTTIVISNLRSRVSRIEVKRLARALILLADPFGDDPEGFNPVLVAPEFEDLASLVKRRYFDDAEYHLVAEVNENGFASAIVSDWKGETLFTATHDDLSKSREGEPYQCPTARFDLWVFILDAAKFSTRSTTLGEVRSWLKEFGGVHLYENGLRVAPYGNPGNDWLGMNLSRARSPEERPSTNTVIGRVAIQDTEQLLIQKTDRSGYIETDAFEELRTFAQDTLEWMARRRLEVAEKRRVQQRKEAPKRSTASRRRVETAIATVPLDAQQTVKKAFKAYDRAREKEVESLQREVQLYRTLSTAGITAATFAHESSGNPIKVVSQSIQAIERRARRVISGEDYKEHLNRPILSIKRAIDSMQVLSSATLKLLSHEKRRTGRVELHAVIRGVLTTFRPFLLARDVTVNTRLSNHNPYLRGSEAAVESIVTNLLNNSVAAFESTKGERVILIETFVTDGSFTMRFIDSGPGITGIGLKDIWLPGKTTRMNGTGLGLTIVRDAVTDLGGAVSAIAHNEELGGAEIIVELPIIGV